jgi:hypothetical protein
MKCQAYSQPAVCARFNNFVSSDRLFLFGYFFHEAAREEGAREKAA